MNIEGRLGLLSRMLITVTAAVAIFWGGCSSSEAAANPTYPGIVTLMWIAPTLNSNGTALGNLAGYDIWYGPADWAMTTKIGATVVGNQLSYKITNLRPGTWSFVVIAVSDKGLQSLPTPIARKKIT